MKVFAFTLLMVIGALAGQGQTRLAFNFPLLDIPQNTQKEHRYPSMSQSMGYSNTLYDLSFWGIDALNNSLFRTDNWKSRTSGYLAGLFFSKYGSELPIPLGVWAHEEYHRSVLGVNGVASKNGNWIFHRWDGTVYGPSDEELADLKTRDVNALLYSYVAGVQYETQLTKENVLFDFYHPRGFYKNPLYLYNAYYVWNYFRFSTSTLSDSVKVIAPKYESDIASERDYAGADLTAWAFDMFSPSASYYDRDDFPDGSGKNRRVGFHDLTPEGQSYLRRQRRLSLLNFLNPSIVMINRIRISEAMTIMPFFQYQPTHFGNALSLNMPFTYEENGYYLGLTQYNNYHHHFYGIDIGVYDFKTSSTEHLSISCVIKLWKQPESFYSAKGKFGGAVQLTTKYAISDEVSLTLQLVSKSAGWMEGNPYLVRKISPIFGLQYTVPVGLDTHRN
ncbi:hypothetical protein [Marinoscillum sp. 108]|uniref:hypothetical protein n=1 Tax=Marinoscillum sp. 108 TaxID=2653151 RepID=UPI0012EF1DF2|nr:hypothetical protein [Marinoscillum sp. 108]VXD13750.1 conserved exported hypothetical protein [Marinoscillum sp. 108]